MVSKMPLHGSQKYSYRGMAYPFPLALGFAGAAGFALPLGFTLATVRFSPPSVRTPDWWKGALCLQPSFRTIDENSVGMIRSASRPQAVQGAGWSAFLIARNDSNTLSHFSQ
jgi:hypothetical protein